MTLHSTLLTLFTSLAKRRKWEITSFFGRNGILELVLFRKNHFIIRKRDGPEWPLVKEKCPYYWVFRAIFPFDARTRQPDPFGLANNHWCFVLWQIRKRRQSAFSNPFVL